MVTGGAEGSRTPGLRIANATLYQLSYSPKKRNRRLRVGFGRNNHMATIALVKKETYSLYPWTRLTHDIHSPYSPT